MAISFVTVGELHYGAYKAKWGREKLNNLKARMRSVVILPYDMDLCIVYGDLKARLSADGKTVGSNDLWIAASAVRHSIPLISNNRKHFEGIPDLVLISE